MQCVVHNTYSVKPGTRYEFKTHLTNHYRNRRIGDFLKELHLTVGRNTGFKKMLDALEANGSPKPEFETDEDRSYFITRLFIHEEFTKDANQSKMNEVDEKNERSFNKKRF